VLRAKTVVVTASVGVLAHGDLTFTPALDPAYPQAFKGLKMETLTKVFLQFNSEVKLELPNINCMCVPLTTEAKVPFINAALWGENIAMMLLTGYLAEDTEQKSEEEIVDYTLETMRTLFGNDKINRANLLAHSHHSWLKDEWSRGCTSYATPGGVAYRKTLGKPVNKQVFFAGEAVSLYAHSSMHGAYETGADAARQILKLLR
jgi:monoamine oxidase